MTARFREGQALLFEPDDDDLGPGPVVIVSAWHHEGECPQYDVVNLDNTWKRMAYEDELHEVTFRTSV